MTPTVKTIEQTFKTLPAKKQAELFARLETIFYGEEDADLLSHERDIDMKEGIVTPLSEKEVRRRNGADR